jgi:hypothetical protein
MLSFTRAATWRQVAPGLEFLAEIPSPLGLTSLSFLTILIHCVECHVFMIYSVMPTRLFSVLSSPHSFWSCLDAAWLTFNLYTLFCFIRASCPSHHSFWVRVQWPNWLSCRYCLLHLLLLPREVISWMRCIPGTHSSVNLISIPWVALYFLDLLTLT